MCHSFEWIIVRTLRHANSDSLIGMRRNRFAKCLCLAQCVLVFFLPNMGFYLVRKLLRRASYAHALTSWDDEKQKGNRDHIKYLSLSHSLSIFILNASSITPHFLPTLSEGLQMQDPREKRPQIFHAHKRAQPPAYIRKFTTIHQSHHHRLKFLVSSRELLWPQAQPKPKLKLICSGSFKMCVFFNSRFLWTYRRAINVNSWWVKLRFNATGHNHTQQHIMCAVCVRVLDVSK